MTIPFADSVTAHRSRAAASPADCFWTERAGCWWCLHTLPGSEPTAVQPVHATAVGCCCGTVWKSHGASSAEDCWKVEVSVSHTGWKSPAGICRTVCWMHALWRIVCEGEGGWEWTEGWIFVRLFCWGWGLRWGSVQGRSWVCVYTYDLVYMCVCVCECIPLFVSFCACKLRAPAVCVSIPASDLFVEHRM